MGYTGGNPVGCWQYPEHPLACVGARVALRLITVLGGSGTTSQRCCRCRCSRWLSVTVMEYQHVLAGRIGLNKQQVDAT